MKITNELENFVLELKVDSGADSDGHDINALSLTLTHSNGEPVSNAEVILKTNWSSFFLNLEQEQKVYTNAEGIALSALADDVAEIVTVTATYVEGGVSTTAKCGFGLYKPGVITLEATRGAQGDGKDKNIIKGIVFNEGWEVLHSYDVLLSVDGDAYFENGGKNITLTSDSNGMVSAEIVDKKNELVNVSMVVGGLSTKAITTFGDDIYYILNLETGFGTKADGESVCNIIGHLTNLDREPIAAEKIVFNVTGSAVFKDSELSFTEVTTDLNGYAFASLVDTKIEDVVVSASFSSGLVTYSKSMSTNFVVSGAYSYALDFPESIYRNPPAGTPLPQFTIEGTVDGRAYDCVQNFYINSSPDEYSRAILTMTFDENKPASYIEYFGKGNDINNPSHLTGWLNAIGSDDPKHKVNFGVYYIDGTFETFDRYIEIKHK